MCTCLKTVYLIRFSLTVQYVGPSHCDKVHLRNECRSVRLCFYECKWSGCRSVLKSNRVSHNQMQKLIVIRDSCWMAWFRYRSLIFWQRFRQLHQTRCVSVPWQESACLLGLVLSHFGQSWPLHQVITSSVTDFILSFIIIKNNQSSCSTYNYDYDDDEIIKRWMRIQVAFLHPIPIVHINEQFVSYIIND